MNLSTRPSSISPVTAAAQGMEMSQLIEFRVNQQRYAFRIHQIREIVILRHITPTPQVPDFVDGVSNLRGSIIPIINLRELFGMPRRESDDETRTIVVHVGDRIMGCTVDTVTQVLRVGQDQIQTAPEMVTQDGGDYIDGFISVDDELVVLLDVDRLLDVDHLRDVAEQSTATQPVQQDSTS